MTRVGLRLDASSALGTGHLRRCLVLAEALRGFGASCRFAVPASDVDARALVEAAGFGFDELPAALDAAEDPDETIAAWRGFAPQVVVVDHYGLDAAWHRAVADAFGARLVAIDDLGDRALAAALVIDPNPSADPAAKFAGRLAPGTRLLAGPRHALLGAAYADAPRCSVGDGVRSIGVFMGGTDPANLTEAALIACRERLGYAGRIEIVTTRANPRHHALMALAARWPHTEVSLDLPDLAAFIARHDLHVGAGGGATWERCCLGAPALVLEGAANQRAVVPELARLEAAATLPPGTAPTAETIAAALAPLLADADQRRRLAVRAAALVDGHGARRVAAAIAAPALALRLAVAADAERLHAWRNHPSVRAVSGNPAPIPLDQHRRWFERALGDPDRLMLVATLGRESVGAIRFDRRADGCAGTATVQAEVSLYLDPVLQGLGLGPLLLARGEAAARRWADAPLDITATVVAGNAASRRLFEAAGYAPLDSASDANGLGHWIKTAAPRPAASAPRAPVAPLAA